jgi:hypothetical protein
LSDGKAPPRPPPKTRIGLTDVERAISVLDGRHPDHEKVARQTREAAERRRGEIAVELARNARRRWLRRIFLGVATLGAAAAAVVGWRLAQGARALRATLAEAEAPWLARGFAVVTSNVLTARRTLDADLPGSTCFVGLATSGGNLKATIDGRNVVGPRSVAWCTCRPGHVTLEAPPGVGNQPAGLAIVGLPGAMLGGPLARSWIDFTPGAWGDGGQECADLTLDAWIDARGGPAAPLEAPWLDAAPARRALAAAGLRIVATLDPAHPFGIVESGAGACAMAVAASDTELSLRGPGGGRLVKHARGVLAWCGARAATLSVWREGATPVAVLSVPAARIGGILGMRESAEAAGLTLPPEATWLRGEDLAWDAGSLLRASGGTDVTAGPLAGEPGPPDARVIALSLAISPDPSVVSEPSGVAVACDPPRAPGVQQTVCAQAAPVSWFKKKDEGLAGAARASLPVWLSTLQGRKEVDAMARIPELLALTRRLARRGFEATALEGVTELPDGVRVVGRAGEDAVVAVGLVPRPPWVLPYTDGVPWDLGDEPRVVAVKPGDDVKLTMSPLPNAPLNTRRTVVFRRVTPP